MNSPRRNHFNGRKWSDPASGVTLPIAPCFFSSTGSDVCQKAIERYEGKKLRKQKERREV